MQRIVFTTAVFLVVGTALAQQVPNKLTGRFGLRNVTIEGITPGGQAVVFGVGLRATGYYSVIFRWSSVVDDADRDGVVTVDLGQEVPAQTIWCLADGTTAQYIVVTPGGAPIPRVSLRAGGAFRKPGALVSQFAFNYSFLDLLYLEPGRGAWIATASDGGKQDRDGPSGMTVVSVEDFAPLGSTTGKPLELRPGGVLVAIDFTRLEVVAERLDAALIGFVR